MGSFELNLHLGGASTTIPYDEFIPVVADGVLKGHLPARGKKSHWGFSAELDSHWAYKQLNSWFALTAGLNGGGVRGDPYSALFGSAFAGLRLTPPTTGYHVDVNAGYSLLKVSTVPINHGAFLALGAVRALPELCEACQIGIRAEASVSGALFQGRGLLCFGYQIGNVPPLPAPTVVTSLVKSPAEALLDSIEERIRVIQSVYGKDLGTCILSIDEVGHFLAWTRGNSDATDCRLPRLQPELKKIETDLAIIRTAAAEHPEWKPRLDAASADLQKTTSLLTQKGMELLVGPQEKSRLTRTMAVGKTILEAIANKENSKDIKAAFTRYQAALVSLQRIFDENTLNIDNTYVLPQKIINCLLTGLVCPPNLDRQLCVPALERRLGLGK